MPAEIYSELVQTILTRVTFDLEPAHNALHSLMLLNNAEELSGLDEWVYRTARGLSPERRHNNRLVLEGLHYAVIPTTSWGSFEAYLNDLTATDGTVLRDRLLERLVDAKCGDRVGAEASVDPQSLLDIDAYLAFLNEYFTPGHFDPELEREAHEYLADPPRLHALLVYHLQTMWREVLRPEWDRVQPILEQAVTAFRDQEVGRTAAVDLVRRVARQELAPHFEAMIQRQREVVLVPSAHIGPYLGKHSYGETMWILFGAHLPQGARVASSALTRSELLVRLAALDDDTRLRILELLAKHGELCAQDVITLLDLSQPAASRHLKQLSATGYVSERRRDGNKCYTLNKSRVQESLQLVDRFLGNG